MTREIDTTTTREMAEQIAPSLDKAAVKPVMRQIQHWTDNGLFQLLDLDPGDVFVGQGKVRRYPREAVWWASIMHELVRRGVGLTDLMLVVTWLHQQPGWVAKATAKAPVFLALIERKPTKKERAIHPDARFMLEVKFLSGEMKIDRTVRSCVAINLSAAVTRVRP